MSDLREAAQQALEALDKLYLPGELERVNAAITALRAALAQQDEGGGNLPPRLQAEPTGKQPLQAEPVATVAENATTQQRVVEALPSDYRRGYWDGFNIGKREGRIEAEDVLAQQDEPCPNCASLEAQNTELDRRLAELERAESAQEPVDVGLLEYRGNSVAFIHQKMTAYRTGIDDAWDAFKAKGLHPDGKTSLADMIAKYTTPPQRKPLTEEEINAEWHELDGEASALFKRVIRKFARAIERAHGIGERP